MTSGQRPLDRDFWRIWAAAVGNRFGDQVRVTAFVLLAAQVTGSPFWLGVAVACNYLPWLCFGLLSGAAVDRLDKRRAFFIADLSRAVVCSLLICSMLIHFVDLPVLIAFAFVLASLQTVSDSSFNAMLPRVVDKQQLPVANARLSAAQGVAGQFVGAPVGAALFVFAREYPFLVNGLTLVLSALLVLRVRVPQDVRGSIRELRIGGLLRDAVLGLRWLLENRNVAAYGYAVGIMNIASSGMQAIMVLYVLHEMRLPASYFGLSTAAWGGGAIIGNLVAIRLIERIGYPGGALCAQGCQVMGYSLLALGNRPATMFVALALNGLGAGSWNVTANAAIQSAIPVKLLARVSSVLRVVAFGTAPIGAVAGGALANAFGLRMPAVLGVLASLAAAALLRALQVSPRLTRKEVVRS